jgi:hypothetical protein
MHKRAAYAALFVRMYVLRKILTLLPHACHSGHMVLSPLSIMHSHVLGSVSVPACVCGAAGDAGIRSHALVGGVKFNVGMQGFDMGRWGFEGRWDLKCGWDFECRWDFEHRWDFMT